MEITDIKMYGESFGPRGNARLTVCFKTDIVDNALNYAKDLIVYKYKDSLRNYNGLEYHVGAGCKTYITYEPRFDDFNANAKLLSMDDVLAYAQKVHDLLMSIKTEAETLYRRKEKQGWYVSIILRNYTPEFRVSTRFYVKWADVGEKFDEGVHVEHECTLNEFMEMSDEQYEQALKNQVIDDISEMLPSALSNEISKGVLTGNMKARNNYNNHNNIIESWTIYATTPETGYTIKRDVDVMRAELRELHEFGLMDWVVKRNIPGFKTEAMLMEERKLADASKIPIIKAEKKVERQIRKKMDTDWVVMQMRVFDLAKTLNKPNP